jgi:Outer membrane lipoprotein
MKKLLLASVAVIALGAPAFAQTQVTTDADTNATIGATSGGVGGAALGAVLGGPIGAVVGGFAGAVIGGEAGVAASTVDYATANPVDPIYIDGSVDVGFVVPADVTIHTVQGDDRYGYIYANDRVWIVDLETRALVQSPGFVVSQPVADYAIGNPVGSVTVDGDIVVGTVLPGDVEVNTIPDSRTYSYVYVNDRPVLVENSSRTVVWVNN